MRKLRKKFVPILAILLLITSLIPSSMITHADETTGSPSTPGNWPVTFTPYTDSSGNPILDKAKEPGVSPDDVDFTSGTDRGIGNLPSFYVASDTTNLFFRMRLKSDPRDRKGGFLSSVWLVHLGVNGKITATVGLDGKSPSDDFIYVANEDGTSAEHIYDTDVTGESVPGTRVVEAENGQYFLDIQVPIAKIEGVTASTPLQFHFATSKAANLSVVNKDGKDDAPFLGGQTLHIDAVPPSIEIDGGNSQTYDASTGVTLTGTTSVETGTGTIDIDGKTYTINISNYMWNYNLPTEISGVNGTYTATVSVTDANNKVATATQEIIIASEKNNALITIDGGAKAVTNSATVKISGKAEGPNGSKVQLYVNGGDPVADNINANNGFWGPIEVTLSDPSDGKVYDIIAEYTDGSGKTIQATASQKLIYKTDATGDAVVLPTVEIKTITGDAIPIVTGISNNANQVELLIDDVTVGIVTPESDGSWSVILEKPLTKEDHLVKAVATNTYGSKAVASQTYTVDTTSISIDNGASVATNDNQPTIRGKANAENGSEVTVTFTNQNDEVETYTTTVESGIWKLEYPLDKKLEDGTYSVTASVDGEDASQELTIDTATTVSILQPDAETDNTKPVISGIAEAGATITLYMNGSLVSTVFADGNGKWTYTPESDLSKTTHTVKAIASDVNGNKKVDEKTFTINSTPTTTPSVQVQKSVISEASANDGSISEKQVITISDGIFAADLSKGDIKINGLPDGLDFTVSRDSDSQITISFTEYATSHTSADDVENITVTVLSTGVSNGTTSFVSGSFAIHFSDPVQEEVTLDHIIVNKDDNEHQRDYSLSPNETYQTSVHGVYSDQSESDISSGADYASSNSDVVTISEEGLVQAIAPGEATITISYEGITVTQTITVLSSEPPFTLTLEVNPDSIVGDGHSEGTITAKVLSKDSSNPVAGVPVTFKIGEGTTSEAVKTNAEGLAEYTFIAPAINSIKQVEEMVEVIAQDTETGTQAEEQIVITFDPPKIQGVLINKVTGMPIAGAKITITANSCNINFETTTVQSGSDGSYTVAVPSGDCNYKLEVETQIEVGNQDINVNTEQTVNVGDVDVSGNGHAIKPKNKITGQLFAKKPDNSSQTISYTDMFGAGNVKVFIHGKKLDGNSFESSVLAETDGTFNFNDVPLGQYQLSYQITVDGTALAGPGATVNVTQEGEVSVVYDLIDPYGVVTDSKGQHLSDVHMKLYWADTALNNGRTPGTPVILPSLPDYPPNQNANPQVTNELGEYGWMVPANGDYYIIATKSGYVDYDSRDAKPNAGDPDSDDSYIKDGIIHIGRTIQALDIQMEKIPLPTVEIKTITGDAIPTISGTSTNANQVELLIDDVTVGFVTPESDGSWEVILEKPLDNGDHAVKAVATNTYGSKAVASQIYQVSITSISIDNGASVATNDNQPTIQGKVNAVNGSTVTVTFTNQSNDVETYTTTVTNGTWKLEYPSEKKLEDGTYTVTAGVDGVNASQELTIDTSTTVSILKLDTETENTKPVISGIAEAGATITLLLDGSSVGTVFANDNGEWTYTPESDLSETEHTVKAIASDVNGNEKMDEKSFTIISTSTATPSVQVQRLIVSEALANDGSISENQVITITNGIFADSLSKNDIKIVGLPDGLDYTVTRDSDSQVTISFTGYATSHSSADDVEEISITVLSSGVVNGNTELVSDSFAIHFSNQPPFTLKLDVDPDSIVGDGQSEGTITATVLSKDANHTPVAGVPVTFKIGERKISEAVYTNEDGLAEYTFTAPAINSIKQVEETVKVIAKDTKTGTQAEKHIVITFDPPKIQGVLINKVTGKPISGANITITANSGCTISFETIVQSGSDGSYTVAVPSGNCDYKLEVETQIKVGNHNKTVKTEQIVNVGNVDVSGNGHAIKPKNKITGQLFAENPANSSQTISYTDDMFGTGNVKVLIHGKKLDGDSFDDSVSAETDGAFNFDDVPLGQYQLSYQITVDGKVLAGPGATVNVTQEGEVSVVYDLIDPYGIVTDSNGQHLSDVHMKLYWADTALNKTKGRKPGTSVDLPSLPDYPPNQNANPQVTNNLGEYGWMVPANGDYYIIATKSGYFDYDSRDAKPNAGDPDSDDSYIKDGIIHIGRTIQALDIQMEKIPVSGGSTPAPSTTPSNTIPAPENLEVTDSGVNKVTLEWDSVVGATNYNIYQDGRTIATGITDLNYTVIGLDPETTYQFIVTAVKNGRESYRSVPTSAETLAKAFSGEHHRYIHGFIDGTFKPEKNVTRAEVAAMLYNLLQLNELEVHGKNYTDVYDSYWAKDAIDAVYSQRLMIGYTDGSFKPNEPITRAELATVIVNVKHVDFDAVNPFSDTQTNWAKNTISIVSKLGIMIGYTDGTFRPNQNITRVETVVALNRMAQRGPLEGVSQSSWPDVRPDYWGFKDIEEASMNHQYFVENDIERLKQD